MSEQNTAPITPSSVNAAGGVMPGLGGNAPDILGRLRTEAGAGEAGPLLLWIGRHRKAIVLTFVAIILAIVGYGLWDWQAEKADRQARMRLGRILIIDDPAERIKGLEAYAAEAPASYLPGINMEIAIAAVAANRPDDAAKAYGAVRTALPGTASGILAGLNEAALLVQTGKAAEAVAVYDAMTGAPEFMRTVLAERKAFALELAGRPAEALAIYKTLPAASDEAGADYVRYKINQLTGRLAK